jgi:hypothetical protein
MFEEYDEPTLETVGGIDRDDGRKSGGVVRSPRHRSFPAQRLIQPRSVVTRTRKPSAV